MRSGQRLARAAEPEESSEPLEPPTDLVEVGVIADAYGVRGEVRIDPFNDPRQSVLLKTKTWWVAAREPLRSPVSGGALPARLSSTGFLRAVKALRCKPHGAVLVASLAGVTDRDAALALKGSRLGVRRADFPPPAAGEFYWVDLVGCVVVNADAQALGTVRAIDDHGAHPILVLLDEQGRERMIPYVPAYVLAVDLAGRQITVDWGLDY